MLDKNNTNGADGFAGWETGGSDEDFFRDLSTDADDAPEGGEGDAPEEAPAPKVVEKAKTKPKAKAKPEPEPEPEPEGDEESEDDSLFGGEDDGDGDEGGDAPEGMGRAVLKFLAEKGLVNLGGDIPEGEDADDLLEDGFETAVDQRVEELFANLPAPVRQLNKYVMEGGDLGEFLSRLSKGGVATLSEDMDLDDEDAQEAVLREALEAEGNDAEEIEAQLEFLKDSGRMEGMARKKYQKWLSRRKAEQEALVRQQAEAKRLEREQLRENRKRVQAMLEETESIGRLRVSREDRKSLPSYMNEKTVPLQNGTSITELQRDIFYEVPKNEKAFLQLAMLMRNRNADGTFNFDGIAREVETEVTRSVKANVRRAKEAMPNRSKADTRRQSKSLADFFS